MVADVALNTSSGRWHSLACLAQLPSTAVDRIGSSPVEAEAAELAATAAVASVRSAPSQAHTCSINMRPDATRGQFELSIRMTMLAFATLCEKGRE
jgi:hypothetical protein